MHDQTLARAVGESAPIRKNCEGLHVRALLYKRAELEITSNYFWGCAWIYFCLNLVYGFIIES